MEADADAGWAHEVRRADAFAYWRHVGWEGERPGVRMNRCHDYLIEHKRHQTIVSEILEAPPNPKAEA